ncbi:MAG: hypothetical protein ACR2NU_04445, partial [Aeoliella sp.]
MGFSQGMRRNGLKNRRGLSFVEFVGCLIALGGGVALGSVYLGVDMKTMFIGILERADIVDSGFFGVEVAAEESIAVVSEDSTGGQATILPDTSEEVTAMASPENLQEVLSSQAADTSSSGAGVE